MIEFEKHPAEIDEQTLLQQCEVRRLRRSGPGGQHRNKVETAIQLRHVPSGVEAEANERRSQAQNHSVAIHRLRVNLALHVRFVRSTKSELWTQRCRNGKISVNPQHDDFPALLAEVLDVIAQQNWDVKSAVESRECTTSQLIKLLKLEPKAFALVNSRRRELELHPLK